tara:strand:- start:93 stop:758 length:666 start_codon:yes stop_codon:yes gene_type:complete
MPKKKKTGLHPGGLLPVTKPKVDPRQIAQKPIRVPRKSTMSRAQPLAKDLDKFPGFTTDNFRNKYAYSVSPIMDQFNKKSKIKPGTGTTYKPPQRTVSATRAKVNPLANARAATPADKARLDQAKAFESSSRRGTDDAFMKEQEKRLLDFFNKNRKPKSVGRSARASGPGRRNRRAPVAQPTRAFPQPFDLSRRGYSYSNGGLTKSTTELKTGLKKAKDSK